jgi:RNA recognition motif-containing protein
MVFGEKEMKQGYAFVRVADADARDRAMNDLDKSQFEGRQVSIQRARGDGNVKLREAERRKNQVQTETIFLVNFEVGM